MTLRQCFLKRVLRFVSLFLTVLTLVGFTAVLHVDAQPGSSPSQTHPNQSNLNQSHPNQIARSQPAIVVRDATSIPFVSVDRLPPEALSTINLIRSGGPFPYVKDGTVFGNRERRLPKARKGYYREYTVKMPRSRDRGAQRIITGQGGEIYYTGDHYASFVRVQ